METCIYLFDTNYRLTYKKKEHVITAGIGGSRTLPNGYVSDQANELFSKYELKCLRYSPLQIARAKYGPGKRGSLNVNSINAPDVFALKPLVDNPNQDDVCPLGFLFQGRAYILPQIVLLPDAETRDFNVVYLKSTYQSSGNMNETEFKLRLREFLISDEKPYINVKMPYNTEADFVCIGCYKKSWYICSTLFNFNISNCASQILEKKPLRKIPRELSNIVYEKPIFNYRRQINLDYMVPIFIHAKNCFNSLALFQGYKFAQQPVFNRFRQCILTNSDWEGVVLPSNRVPSKISKWFLKNLHSHEHAVTIYTDAENIMALSVLYGELWGLFKLGEGYQGEPFSRAVICDYKNKNEKWFDSNVL